MNISKSNITLESSESKEVGRQERLHSEGGGGGGRGRLWGGDSQQQDQAHAQEHKHLDNHGDEFIYIWR